MKHFSGLTIQFLTDLSLRNFITTNPTSTQLNVNDIQCLVAISNIPPKVLEA